MNGVADVLEPFGVGQLLEGTPYRLTRALARGASAFVYRAEHTKLGSPVIVKIMAATVDAAPELAGRMRQEAQALARLAHPNLVAVTDSGIASGRLFFVMDDDGGTPLAEVLGAAGRMTVEDAILVASEVLEGLAFIHESGLVHRDLHPNNLLVCPRLDGGRTVRILDLGLVKVLGGHERHNLQPLAIPTAEGVTLGTPHFMAPEQARGGTVDARADLYAVGCVLYRLLTGREPFAHHAAAAHVLAAHLREYPTPPSVVCGPAVVGQAVEAVLMAALAKRPEDRFDSARAMKGALLAARERDARAAPTATPTVVGESAHASRTESIDALPEGAPIPFHTNQATTRALAPFGEPDAPASLRSEAPTRPVGAGNPPVMNEPPRPSRYATVLAFGAAWLVGLLLTVVTLVATQSCGRAAHGARGGPHGERVSSR